MNNVVSLRIDDIAEGDRLRGLDPDYVALIRASIEAHGLMQPIEVRAKDKSGKFVLISGAHRLAAVMGLNWTEIDARIFEGDDVKAELRQIDENLFRRELSALDRATFLARRKELYEAENPNTRKGGDRRSDQSDKFVALIPSFTSATAEKLGVDVRSVQRAIQRHERLAPDVRGKIATTYLANKGSELDAISRLPPDEQRKVVQHILGRKDERPTVAAAVAALRGKTAPEKSATEKQYGWFLSLWKRCGAPARRKIRAFLETDESRS